MLSLLLLALLLAGAGASLTHEELQYRLCTDYSSIPRHIHIHNQEYDSFDTYLIRFSYYAHNITITVDAPSILRASISSPFFAPTLTRDDIGFDASFVGRDGVIAYANSVQPGEYVVELGFTPFPGEQPTSCPVVSIHFAGGPLEEVKQRASLSNECNGESIYPTMEVPSSHESFMYDSAMSDTSLMHHPQGQSGIRFLKWFPLCSNGDEGLYNLQTGLAPHFLTGGAMWLVLSRGSEVSEDQRCDTGTPTAPMLSECVTLSDGVELSDSDMNPATCWVGKSGALQNQVNFGTTLRGDANYVLWIVAIERMFVETSCVPYHFYLHTEPLTVQVDDVTCNAIALPDRLDDLGYTDGRGVLSFHSTNIFLSPGAASDRPESTVFTVQTQSVLRVYAAPHDVVDIDVALYKGIEQIAGSTNDIGVGDGFVVELSPGDYELLFGFYNPPLLKLCETMHLEIDLMPVDYLREVDDTPMDCSSAVGLPDISGLESVCSGCTVSIPNNPGTTPPSAFERFFVSPVGRTQDLIRQPIGVETQSLLVVDLECSPALAGVQVVIEGVDAESAEDIRASCGNPLRIKINPWDTPELLIQRLPIQENASPFREGPSCVPVDIAVGIFPWTSADTVECPLHDRAPERLDWLSMLGSSQGVQTRRDNMHIPQASTDQSYSSIWLEFDTHEDLVFRLNVEPHERVDIDLALWDMSTNHVFANSVREKGYRETVAAHLPAAVGTYKVEVRFFHVDPMPCETFAMDVLAAPAEDLPDVDGDNGCSESESLPSQSFFVIGATPVRVEDEFLAHPPEGDAQEGKVVDFTFVVPSPAARVEVTLTTDPLLNFFDLYLTEGMDEDAVHILAQSWRPGTLFVPSRLLSAGTYTVHIHITPKTEPFNSCARFSLIMEADPETTSGGGAGIAEPVVCTALMLPPSLNLPECLSDLSAGTCHTVATFRPDLTKDIEEIPFDISTPSFFSITVVPPSLVAVTVSVRPPGGTAIASENLFLAVELQPGSYVLQFSYDLEAPELAVGGCPSLRAELAVTPVELQARLPDVCGEPTTPLPTSGILHGEHHYSVVHRFEFGEPDATHTLMLPFTIGSDGGIFGIKLQADFTAIGNMSVRLYREDLTDIGISNTVGFNKRFIYTELAPGNYLADVTISDGLPMLRDAGSECTVFFVRLRVSEPTDDVVVPDQPETVEEDDSEVALTEISEFHPCEMLLALPTDLYSNSGGSDAFGGPQDYRGRVHIYGNAFPIASSTNVVHDILFQVKEDSLLRVWLYAPGHDIDLDVIGDAAGSPITYATSLSTDASESATVVLPPADSDYLLQLSYYNIDLARECDTFQLEIAIEPLSAVQESLDCAIYDMGAETEPAPDSGTDVRGSFPPSEVVVEPGADVHIFSDTYFYEVDETSSFRYFPTERHSMDVYMRGNGTLFAYLEFDFAVVDLTLTFYGPSGYYWTYSISTPSGERGDGNLYGRDFRQEITMNGLSPGKYTLEIRAREPQEAASSAEPRLSVPFCVGYTFGLEASATEYPHLLAIQPEGGTMLNSEEDLTIELRFSVPVVPSVAKDGFDGPLLEFLRTNEAVFLQSWSYASLLIETRTILPASASYVIVSDSTGQSYEDKSRVGVTFPHDELKDGERYWLSVDTSVFRTEEGSELAPMLDDFVYAMRMCFCSEHGACPDDSEECECEVGYSGRTCSSCADGFHLVGRQCVVNAQCSSTTCNGNGQCDDSSGSLHCSCETGFATIGDDYCGSCSPGYQGYPDCMRVDDAVAEEMVCDMTVLPTSLDTISFLGDTGKMHLQGEFLIDLDHSSHEIFFTLHKPSLLRAYVAPHRNIDIDLWLYEIDGSGNDKQLAYEVSLVEEESMVIELPVAVNGKTPVGTTKYRLKLKYFNWYPTGSEFCESLNFELAIAPTASLQTEVSAVESSCQGRESLPSFTEGLKISDDYEYSVEDRFSLIPQDTDTAVSDSSRPYNPKPRFVVGLDFAVEAVQGREAFLSTWIDYRFLLGDLNLMLEELDAEGQGQQDPSLGPDFHLCAQSRMENPSCVFGINKGNQNAMNRAIAPGNYRLWIYEPVPLDSRLLSCAEFEFDFKVTFGKVEEDPVSCGSPPLPDTLDTPEFLGFVRDGLRVGPDVGIVHILDSYLIDMATMMHSISFTLAEESLVRFFVPHHSGVDVDIELHDRSGSNLAYAINFYGDETILTTLASGEYSITLYYFALNAGGEDWYSEYCVTIGFEVEIVPTSIVDRMVGQDIAFCAAEQELPAFSPLEPPFAYGTLSPEAPTSVAEPSEGDMYIHRNTLRDWDVYTAMPVSSQDQSQQIAIYDFTVPITMSTALIKAELGSDFLLGHLRLSLVRKDDDEEVLAQRRPNMEVLSAQVPPGEYSLVITLPKAVPSSYPQCVPFTIGFAVEEVVAVGPIACENADDNALTRRPPPSFNVPGLLGALGRVHGFERFLLPADVNTEMDVIRFKVDVKSEFRFLVEEHEKVDVDIMLESISGDTRTYIAASMTRGTDFIVSTLDPAFEYELTFIYLSGTSWEPLTECDAFTVEYSIVPLFEVGDDGSSTPPSSSTCPSSGSDHWPTRIPATWPTADPDGFRYDTVSEGEHLYIQQRAGEAREFRVAVTIQEAVDVFIEVGFDFLVGPVVVRLEKTDKASNSDNWWGNGDDWDFFDWDWYDLFDSEAGEEYVGSGALNRYTLSERQLPPGNYSLLIVEPSRRKGGDSDSAAQNPGGCVPFMFRMDVRKSSDRPKFASIPPLAHSVPPSLNTLAYLAYEGSFHAEAHYALPPLDTLKWQMAIQPEEDTVFRLVLDERFVNSEVYVTKSNSGETVARGTEGMLLTDFQGGQKYVIHLQFTGPLGSNGKVVDWDASSTFRMEMEAAPSSDVQSRLPSLDTCTVDLAPEITLTGTASHPEKIFVYNHEPLLFHAHDGDDLLVLHSMSFHTSRTMVLSASINYDFLVTDMALEISGFASVHGVNTFNRNTLLAELEAGYYTLKVKVARSPGQVFEQAAQPCVPYGMNIRIAEASVGGMVDCEALTTLFPEDLNGDESVPFGGPISRHGVAHIAGEGVLLTEEVITTPLKSSLHLDLPSMVRLWARAESTSVPDISLMTVDGNELVPPVQESAAFNNWEATNLYLVGAGDLSAHFRVPERSKKERCPTFDFAVMIAPEGMVKHQMRCPVDDTLLNIPDLLEVAGGAISQFQNVFIKETDVGGDKHYEKSVHLQVSVLSELRLGLAYDAMISEVKSDLLATMGGFEILFHGTETRPLHATEYSEYNFEATMTAALYPGNYTLRLSTSWLVDSACLPFLWSLDVRPIEEIASELEVRYVRPLGAFNLPSERPFDLEVAFPSRVYKASSNEPVSSSDGTIVKDAVRMQSTKDSSFVHPASALPVDADGVVWRLSFPIASHSLHEPELLQPGGEYKLSVMQNQIVAHRGEAIVLNQQHIYQINPCLNAGREVEGVCICPKAYAGDNCEHCAKGYKEEKTSHGAVCVKSDDDGGATTPAPTHVPVTHPNTHPYTTAPSHEKCTYDYCGNNGRCEHNSYGERVCSCYANYAGSKCDQCADGFSGYPRCTMTKQCITDCMPGGSCDHSTGRCSCRYNWAGDACDHCASGYSGSDCSAASHDDDNNTPSDGHGFWRGFRVVTLLGTIMLLLTALGRWVWDRVRSRRDYTLISMNDTDDDQVELLDWQTG
eukprot:Rmarinus@m.5621